MGYFAFPGIIEFASHNNNTIEFGRRRGSRDKKKRMRKGGALGLAARAARSGAIGAGVGAAASSVLDKNRGANGGARLIKGAKMGAAVGAGGQLLKEAGEDISRMRGRRRF